MFFLYSYTDISLLQESVLDTVDRGQTKERDVLIELLASAHENDKDLSELKNMSLPVSYILLPR